MSFQNNPIIRGIISIFHLVTDYYFLYEETDLKCPICKLNNPSKYKKCAHCGYEFTELETLERIELDRRRYYKNLTLGLFLFTIFFLILLYMINKYYL